MASASLGATIGTASPFLPLAMHPRLAALRPRRFSLCAARKLRHPCPGAIIQTCNAECAGRVKHRVPLHSVRTLRRRHGTTRHLDGQERSKGRDGKWEPQYVADAL